MSIIISDRYFHARKHITLIIFHSACLLTLSAVIVTHVCCKEAK